MSFWFLSSHADGSNHDAGRAHSRPEAEDREADNGRFGGRGGARREGIIVAFNEVSKENYASGGELMIDKGK